MDLLNKVQASQDIPPIPQNITTDQEKILTKPISINFIQPVEKFPKIYILILTLLVFLIFVLLAYYFDFVKSDFLDNTMAKFNKQPKSITYLSQNRMDTLQPCINKGVPLEEVNNVGYTFLLGQLDYPNSVALTDDIKNNITQVIYKSKFPKRFLENIAIVIVNTLAIKPNDKIDTPYGEMDVPELGPIFLRGGGYIGQYKSHTSFNCYRDIKDGEIFIIYLNKDKIYEIDDILTHELGHFIESKMTEEDWIKYYQLRNIPNDTPRDGQVWSLSPAEDFAEVYKYIFTGLRIKTYWGILKVNNFDDGPCLILKNKLF